MMPENGSASREWIPERAERGARGGKHPSHWCQYVLCCPRRLVPHVVVVLLLSTYGIISFAHLLVGVTRHADVKDDRQYNNPREWMGHFNDGSHDTDISWYDDGIVTFGEKHPAFVPMDPKYVPEDVDAWQRASVPDINIVGAAKAGTSQLYLILSSHPNVTKYHPETKEYVLTFEVEPQVRPMFTEWNKGAAPDPASGITKQKAIVQERAFTFHKQMYQEHVDDGQSLTVNGCLWTDDVLLSWFYFHGNRQTNALSQNHGVEGTAMDEQAQVTTAGGSAATSKRKKKYIYIFRDIADWLWSVYNFYQSPNIDEHFEGTGMWTSNSSVHYRSPEMFHEIIESGTRTAAGAELTHTVAAFAVNPKALLEVMRHSNGTEDEIDVLFLRNEDLLPENVNEPGGALDRLVNFTGLGRDGFNQSLLATKHNCNDSKGETKSCGGGGDGKADASKRAGPRYSISGKRSMLPETRQLIYRRFWNYCYLFYIKFGIEYPDCLKSKNDFHMGR